MTTQNEIHTPNRGKEADDRKKERETTENRVLLSYIGLVRGIGTVTVAFVYCTKYTNTFTQEATNKKKYVYHTKYLQEQHQKHDRRAISFVYSMLSPQYENGRHS